MSEIAQAPAVDTAGNIVLHGRSGLTLALAFDQGDGDPPSPRDVAGLPIFFEVAGTLRVALGAGPTSDVRVLQLGDEHVELIWGKPPLPFAFRDESGAEPDVFWAGTIRTTGFSGQPA